MVPCYITKIACGFDRSDFLIFHFRSGLTNSFSNLRSPVYEPEMETIICSNVIRRESEGEKCCCLEPWKTMTDCARRWWGEGKDAMGSGHMANLSGGNF